VLIFVRLGQLRGKRQDIAGSAMAKETACGLVEWFWRWEGKGQVVERDRMRMK
jgi:hypothetical protein